jgi:molybdate transport system substrate-binding protein
MLALLASAGCTAHNEAKILTVSVAASLQNAMTELARAFERSRPGVRLQFNFGGSGTLAQHIEQGAPVDVFFAAAPKPMDALARKSLIVPETRRDIVRNRIVLIAKRGSTAPDSFAALTAEAVKLVALGDPASVPAGDYGRQVLESLKLWTGVQHKLVLAKDVRQVLTYVETGNAEAGIVYATDAMESAKVRVAETAPEDSHTPVIYPAAVIAGSRNPAAARAFVAFLSGSEAREVFTRRGFTVVSP